MISVGVVGPLGLWVLDLCSPGKGSGDIHPQEVPPQEGVAQVPGHLMEEEAQGGVCHHGVGEPGGTGSTGSMHGSSLCREGR